MNYRCFQLTQSACRTAFRLRVVITPVWLVVLPTLLPIWILAAKAQLHDYTEINQSIPTSSKNVQSLIDLWELYFNGKIWSNGMVPIGTEVLVSASPKSDGTAFPSGQPGWSGLACGTVGSTKVTFDSASSKLNDFKQATATWGRSNCTGQVLVYMVSSVTTATNRVIAGSNSVRLIAGMQPATGGAELLSWSCTNGTLTSSTSGTADLKVSAAGIYTVVATCGTSTASQTIHVSAITNIVGQDLVAIGDEYLFNAQIAFGPAAGPVTWSTDKRGIIVDTPTPTTALIKWTKGGYRTITAHLGNSTAWFTLFVCTLAGDPDAFEPPDDEVTPPRL